VQVFIKGDPPNVVSVYVYEATLTMVRITAFPVIFGASLVALTVGFYNRRKFFPEVEEIHERKARESHFQAQEFKVKVAEGVKKKREEKADK